MAKIDRFDGNLKAFGSDAIATERTVFGDLGTQSDSLDDNIISDFFRGWGIIGVNDFPPIEFFNAIGFTATQLLAYLHQMGIAEYNTEQEYHIGSACIDGAGKIYISKTASNIGNALPADSDTHWKRVLDFADLNNTALTGVPTAPTAAAGTATTQIATTEFVSDFMANTFTAVINYANTTASTTTFTDMLSPVIQASSYPLPQTVMSISGNNIVFNKKCIFSFMTRISFATIDPTKSAFPRIYHYDSSNNIKLDVTGSWSSFSNTSRESISLTLSIEVGDYIVYQGYHNATARQLVADIRGTAFNIEG